MSFWTDVSRFHDRSSAGRELASRLTAYANRTDVLILALPRGGLPVGFEVAKALDAPLDAFLVRKLGVPGHEELAMGAIAMGGVRVLNADVVEALHIPADVIDAVAAREGEELMRRQKLYRDDWPTPEVRGRIAILVDDGLATGSTMRAAAAALRLEGPARLVIAVPTAAPETCRDLASEVDEIVCVVTPEPFYAVGLWYEDFSETSDADVRHILEKAAQVLPAVPTATVGG